MSTEPHRRSRAADLAVTTDQRARYLLAILRRHWYEATHPAVVRAVVRAVRGQLAKAEWVGMERERDRDRARGERA